MRTILNVNFYSAQMMVSTAFMVAHNKILFIYDVLNSKIVKRIDFTSQVIKLQRIEVRKGVYNVLAIMENGQIIWLVNSDADYQEPEGWKIDVSRNQ